VGVGAVWTADMHRELVTTLAASRVSANLTGGGGLGHWRRRVLERFFDRDHLPLRAKRSP
ncbi:MAG: hypothetical protein WBE53_17480, partial [Pseudolabrys sp.]